MNHGTAIIKESLLGLDGKVAVEKGEEGLVTAYLPEMETFAVWFADKRWFTFKESEKEFLKRFEYKK